MKTKVQLKNLYLIAIIAIGLIGLGVGSTFAMFTASTNIDNPIAFSSNLSSTNNLAETIEVVVPANSDKSVDLVISNTSGGNINYSTWYSPSSNTLEVGSESSNNSYGPSGILSSASNFTLTVQLRNSGSSSVTVTLGVSSSGSSVILPSGATEVPASELPHLLSLSDFTYVLGSDQTTISTLSTDFYNSSNDTMSEQSNVTLPASISINQNEVLLTRYIGTETEVNIPNTFAVNGNTYNVVLLSYLNDGSNLSTGVFYRNDDIEDVSFGNNIKYIALNSSGNGYDNYSIFNMFNNCTNLSSLNLTNIDLDNVTTYTNALNGVSTSTTITVPNCTQYRSFISKFGTSYTGLSATTNDYTCNYELVDYIEATGTQYINLGLYPTQDYGVEIEYAYTSLSSSDSARLFGTRNGAGDIDSFTFISSYSGALNSTAYMVSHNGTFATNTDNIAIDLNWHRIESNKNNDKKFYYDGVLKGTGASTAFTSNGELSLFRTYNQNSYGMPTKARVRLLKIYDNGELIRNLVPCYRKSDGVVGMYDTVNDVFYTNSNTDPNVEAFGYGDNVNY